MKSKTKNNILLILTALIWGLAFVAQSVGMDYVGPFTFNTIRSLIGGLFLIPCILFLDKKGFTVKSTQTKEAKKKLVKGGIYCGIALGIASNLQQIGIMYTSVGKAGFITALYIVLVPVFGLFLKKKVSIYVWISVFIALIGMYLLCIKEGFSIGLGDGLIFICAIVFTFHILIIDAFSTYVDCVRMACIQFFVAGILSSVGMFIFETPTISSILSGWMPILYAGILSCGVAYTLQIVAQKNTDPTVASLILSLESVFSLLGGFLILGQVLTIREVLGCILVFNAICLAQLPGSPKKETKHEVSSSIPS